MAITTSKLTILRRLFLIGKPFWVGDKKKEAYKLLLLTITLLAAKAYVSVKVSYALSYFMDSLQNKHVHDAQWDWVEYALWLALLTPVWVNFEYFRSRLALEWRMFLTPYVFKKYYDRRAYLAINRDELVDNPDQRMTQNVEGFCLTLVGLFISTLEAITFIVFFFPVLWGISHLLTGAVMAYSAIGSVIAILIAKRLVPLNFQQDKLEADLRFAVAGVRRDDQSIALLRGEDREREYLNRSFKLVTDNFLMIVRLNKRLTYFTTYYNFLVPLIPALFIGQSYVQGDISLGALTQAGVAFTQMYNSGTLIVSQFNNFSTFASIVNRLGSFFEALDRHYLPKPTGETIQTVESDHLHLDHIHLLTPDSEQVLIEDLTVDIPNGSSLLITGANGVGKSTLLSAIAGIDDTGTGTIGRPALDSTMFLPQQPYVRTSTLREALCYPGVETKVDEVQLRKWLKVFKLENLEKSYGFDTVQNWREKLTVIEQQHLSFARIMIFEPKYLFLDEPTAGIEEDEQQFFTLLQALNATIVTTSQNAGLAKYHTQVIQLSKDGSVQTDPGSISNEKELVVA